MNLTVWERAQRAQDLIERRHLAWFLGCAALVALVTLCGA